MFVFMYYSANMKAQVINSFGDPSVFTLVDLPVPTVKPGHVLLKVHATSVNPIDCILRSGAIPPLAPEFPAILQGDVAGTVEAVGEGVTQFKKGDEIYGFAGGCRGIAGALAEYMLVDEKLMAKKPKSLSMQASAALPIVAITAWISLFEKAKLSKGTKILIYAGVGGVGHIAVQLAKWAEAKVYATVRNKEDISLAKSFGADEIINVSEENVDQYNQRVTNNTGFEVIFDTIGKDNLNNSCKAAALNGTIVTTNAALTTLDLTLMHRKSLSLHCLSLYLPLLTNQHREDYGVILEKIAKIVDEGKLKPLVDPHNFKLENVKEAHELLESGKAKRKVVISIK